MKRRQQGTNIEGDQGRQLALSPEERKRQSGYASASEGAGPEVGNPVRSNATAKGNGHMDKAKNEQIDKQKRAQPKDKDPNHLDVVRETESLQQKDGTLDTPDVGRRPEGQGSRN